MSGMNRVDVASLLGGEEGTRARLRFLRPASGEKGSKTASQFVGELCTPSSQSSLPQPQTQRERSVGSRPRDLVLPLFSPRGVLLFIVCLSAWSKSSRPDSSHPSLPSPTLSQPDCIVERRVFEEVQLP